MKLNKLFILLFVLIAGLWACNDDAEESTITQFAEYEISPITPVVLPEGGTHAIEIDFPAEQILDLQIDIEAGESSTATYFGDYFLVDPACSVVETQFDVPAFDRKGVFHVCVQEDQTPEGDETIHINFTDHGEFNLPKPLMDALVVTIRDSIYPAGIELDWGGEVMVNDTTTVEKCDAVDIDLFLANGAGDFVGGFGGATGACPEYMYAENFDDGEYSIIANLYDNGLLDSMAMNVSEIPLQVKLFKGGVLTSGASTLFYSTSDYPSLPLWNSLTPSDPNGDFLVEVGKIRVGGGKVDLLDPNGAVVGTVDQ